MKILKKLFMSLMVICMTISGLPQVAMVVHAAGTLDSISVECREVWLTKGYHDTDNIPVKITQTFSGDGVTVGDWADISVLAVNNDYESEYISKFRIIDNSVATLSGNSLTKEGLELSISDGLGLGDYEVSIGNGTISAVIYVYVVQGAQIGNDYKMEIEPKRIVLNPSVTKAKAKVILTKVNANADSIPSDKQFIWVWDERDNPVNELFDFPEGYGNDQIEIKLVANYEDVLKKIKNNNPEVTTFEAKFSSQIYLENDICYLDRAKVVFCLPQNNGTEIVDGQATYKVTGTGEAEYEAPKDATASTVVIPDEIKDANGNVYKVTAVAPNAFKKNKKVKTAKFGKYVTTIGAGAFDGASNLKNLELDGNVVKTIGKNAFRKTKKGLKVKIFAKNKKTAQKLFNKVVKKGKAKGAVLKFKKRK